MGIVFLVSIFISISILVETIGVWFRYIGALHNEAALGYCTHVRVATLGRFFILLSAPMLGFMIDSGIPPGTISFIGVLAFSIVFSLLSINFFIHRLDFLLSIYRLINRYTETEISHPSISMRHHNIKLISTSVFSFIMTASGILIVNYLATIFPENRAMLVQMSAFVTMLGTLMHAFLIDPALARACDKDTELAYNVVKDFLLGRSIASLVLIILFLGLSFYVK
jgi:hypothetical protein